MIREWSPWVELPLFERQDESGAWVKLSALDIGKAVSDGLLFEAELVRLPLPGNPVRLVRARDVMDAAKRGARGLDGLAEKPGAGRLVEFSAASSGPAGRLSAFQKPPKADPAPVPAPSQRTPEERSWRRLLTWKTLAWVLLGYYTLGTGFWFFITSNPETTVPAIVGALLVAVFKSAAILVGVFVWVSILTRSSENFAVVAFGIAAVGFLVGATNGYRGGVNHLLANQLAPMQVLVDRCMEEGMQFSGRRIGAVCADGRHSRSTGRGTCSHHGGVYTWKYAPGRQTRTVEECRVRAERIRW